MRALYCVFGVVVSAVDVCLCLCLRLCAYVLLSMHSIVGDRVVCSFDLFVVLLF